MTSAQECPVEPRRAEPADVLTPEEFEAEVQQIASPLMGTALRLTRSRVEAEDLVQETLFRAYRALDSFRKGSRFKAWVFRILHNVFINRGLREARAPAAVDPAEMSVPDGAHPVPALTTLGELPALIDAHLTDGVKHALEDVPEVYRVPFVLFSLADLSYQEIAHTLGIPIGTVMSRLHRARRLLKERLAETAHERGLIRGGRDD